MLVFEKELLITFNDLIAGARKNKQTLSKFTTEERDTCLQFIHDFMILDNDQVYVSDSRWKAPTNRQLQIAIGLHYAVLQSDTSAGTGSLSGKSIDSFSVSYTMAKNNAPFNDWMNMTQYGTRFLELIKRRDYSTRFGIA